MHARALQRRAAGRGLSYVEVMLATALIAVALAPALQAVTGGLLGARVHSDMTQGMPALFGKMEELLARPYPVLYRAAIAGGSAGGSATTAIALFDPAQPLVFPLPATVPAGPGFSDADVDVFIHSIDPGTGADAATDTGLLQVRVQAKVGGQTLRAFKARTEAFE